MRRRVPARGLGVGRRRAAGVCASSLALYLGFALFQEAVGLGPGIAMGVMAVAFSGLGAAWRRSWSTGLLAWIGAQAGVVVVAVAVPPVAGIGPFLWYSTSVGFVAGFFAWVGGWLRAASSWGPSRRVQE